MYVLADIKEIVENQDLCRNRDDFKKIVFFNERDFIFHMYIYKMYILADIFNEIVKNSRFIYEQRRLLKKYKNKKFVFFYLKDFIFYRIFL